MKKILLVVDYQVDFVSGALGFAGAELLDRPIAEKIKEYGKGNVFYTLDTHFDNYLDTKEGKNLPVPHCIKGTAGWEVYGETKQALFDADAVCIEKRSFGIDFTDETLSKLPRAVDSVEIVGLVSNICVISNAVILNTLYSDAEITVDAALTASFDDMLNKEALDVMSGLQINVINRKDR
ncbi:MAG: cysteine hydrolase family protein [Acutalibacteraceae bacterium]